MLVSRLRVRIGFLDIVTLCRDLFHRFAVPLPLKGKVLVRLKFSKTGIRRGDYQSPGGAMWKFGKSIPRQGLPVPSSVAFGATFPPGKVFCAVEICEFLGL
jgi:hypothetical protein